MVERHCFVTKNGSAVSVRDKADPKLNETQGGKAHDSVALWISLLVIFVVSLAAFYLFWAKITFAWPFLR
jgi:hypothetical protein